MNLTESPKSKKIRWFLWLRITGIILFIVVLFRVDLKEIWEHIRVVSPLFLILAILSQLVLLLVKGLRWNRMSDRKNDREAYLQSMGEFMESYAIGVITPGRLGELVKAGYQSTRSGVFASGLRVMAERGLDVGFFVMVAGAALLFELLVTLPVMVGYLVSGTGVLIFVATVLLFSSEGLVRLLKRLFGRFTVDFEKYDLSSTLSIIVLSLISNAFAFISCWFLALGLGMPLSVLGVSGGVAIAGLINILPITIMGLGTREVAFLFIFHELPVSQVLALSGLILLVAQIGGGVLAMIMGQLFLALKKREVNKSGKIN